LSATNISNWATASSQHL